MLEIRQETKIYEVFTIRQDEIENFLDEDEFYSEKIQGSRNDHCGCAKG